MGRGKRCFSFSFQGPPSIETFQGPLSIETFQGPRNIGTFQGPPNIGTFHWPPNWDLPSPPLKGKFGSFGAFFSGHNFQFKSWEYLFPQPSGGGKKWLILVNGGKSESRLDVCNTFERMEVNRDNVGSLKS